MNPHLASLVVGLAAQAEQVLTGGLPGGAPEGTSAREMARALIDTLGMLEEKTRGNLEPDEQKLLAEALTRIRFQFVTSEKKAP